MRHLLVRLVFLVSLLIRRGFKPTPLPAYSPTYTSTQTQDTDHAEGSRDHRFGRMLVGRGGALTGGQEARQVIRLRRWWIFESEAAKACQSQKTEVA